MKITCREWACVYHILFNEEETKQLVKAGLLPPEAARGHMTATCAELDAMARDSRLPEELRREIIAMHITEHLVTAAGAPSKETS